MSNNDIPNNIEDQIILMKKYVVFNKKIKMRRFLLYSGYFRVSRYGKYLLSYTSILRTKPNQELLFEIYNLDAELRKLFFHYCKKAEIQFKSHLSNSVSLKLNDSVFYLDKSNYTDTKGENDKNRRKLNKRYFVKFYKNIVLQEKELRRDVNKYPELKEYRTGGQRSKKRIPSWAAFNYFEFGTLTIMYSFLRGDLRKVVLNYGYSQNRYGKEVTKQMDTWLDAIRNLRNICAHHNRLVGRTSSIVLAHNSEDGILVNQTDLFSRLYALKKVLSPKDSEKLKQDLKRIVDKSQSNIYNLSILPIDWENKFDSINYL